MMLIYVLYFILAAAVLTISATTIVKSLVKIAHFMKISEFTAAFIIMALATSSPELFVGISSALSNNSAISLGNVVGASIIDLTLFIGIFTLVGRGIKIKPGNLGKNIYHVIFPIILLLILYIINNSLSRIDGIILLAFFVLNSHGMFKRSKKYKSRFRENHSKNKHIVYISFIFILSIFVLFFSSHYAVKYASLIAEDLKLPKILVGLFLLSLATSLPELVFGLNAIKMRHKILALGDITGGVITNLTLVTGLVALISPIQANFTQFIISAAFLFISAFIFITFLKSDREIRTGEGIALILLYIFFIIIEFFLK